jgi:hypothetical protein
MPIVSSSGGLSSKGYGFLSAPPGVVLNGLVLFLDADNPNSYPGSGDNFFDLSGSGFTSTRIGSITYQSDPPKSFIFPGVDNDRITIGDGFNNLYRLFCDNTQSFSVSVWYRWVSNPSVWGPDNHSHSIFGKGGGIGGAATFILYGSINSNYNNGVVGSELTQFGVPGVVLRGALTNVTSSRIDNNTWNNTVVTWDGATARLYHNGVFTKNAAVGPAADQLSPAALGTNNNSALSPLHKFQGNISSTLVYNRSITAEEVSQNFNAFRSRYGI